jgi:hypothetical protein
LEKWTHPASSGNIFHLCSHVSEPNIPLKLSLRILVSVLMSRKCSNSDVRPFRTRRMPTPLPPCRSASTPTREYELYIMYLHIKKNHQSFFSLRLHLHKPGSSWDAPPVASSTILFASSSPPQRFASARASTSSSLSLPPPHCSVVPRVELVAGAATFCSSSPPRAAILLLVLQYSEGHWDMVLLTVL